MSEKNLTFDTERKKIVSIETIKQKRDRLQKAEEELNNSIEKIKLFPYDELVEAREIRRKLQQLENAEKLQIKIQERDKAKSLKEETDAFIKEMEKSGKTEVEVYG